MGTNGQGSGKAFASAGRSMSETLRDAAIHERDRSESAAGSDTRTAARAAALGSRGWIPAPSRSGSTFTPNESGAGSRSRFQRALLRERATPTPPA